MYWGIVVNYKELYGYYYEQQPIIISGRNQQEVFETLSWKEYNMR